VLPAGDVVHIPEEERNLDANRLSQGQMIAGVSAIALFIFLFLPWLGADLPEGVEVPEGTDDSFNAWKATQTLDFYLLIVALMALVPAALALSGSRAAFPFAGAATTFILAVIGVLLIIILLIDPGEGAETKIGLWLGLLATAGVAVGSWLAMQDEATGARRTADRTAPADRTPADRPEGERY